ncbi:MAG: TraB/GumN family protein [Halobacteriales archaeon]|nr:TraB/GumN family protein [Halobacteriales archaeon]
MKTALIDERDEFMASHIREQAAKARVDGGAVVAVVGAGHLNGIGRWLDHPKEIPPRERLLAPPPKRFPWGTVIGLAIPVAIALWLAWELYQGHTEKVTKGLWLWVVLHFVLAGLGALLAFGHPLAVLTGAAAAPLTSILPVGVRSGWIAGFVQAKLRKPKVKDFQEIKHVETFGQFWKNGVVRILMVTSLTILGSEAASIVAGIMIAKGAFF